MEKQVEPLKWEALKKLAERVDGPGDWYTAGEFTSLSPSDAAYIAAANPAAILELLSELSRKEEEIQKLREGELSDVMIRLIAPGLGWELSTASLYDEECVEGWRWTAPDGSEFVEIGNHLEPPAVPSEVRELVAKKIAELESDEMRPRY